MASNCVRYVTLDFNCGFARTAVRQLTPKIHGTKIFDKQKRAEEFKQLFSACPEYGFPDSYFDDDSNAHGSLFNRDCDKILKIWSKRWNPTESRQQYEQVFSIEKWKTLTNQQAHTLAKCKACQVLHYNDQLAFPQGPYFEKPLIIRSTEELQSLGTKHGTIKTLAEVNTAFSNIFNTTFTESVIQYGKQGIQKKPTALERKKKRREIYRQCRDKENEALQRSTAIAVLTEDESIRAYQRKRKRQYFENTPSSKRAKTKSHSPNFDTVMWDKDKVLPDLQQHLPAPPSINWQQFAREHGVPGRNGGQVVKEFAKTSGIDTEMLDGKASAPRTRACRRKLFGGEISVVTTPTPASIKQEWKKMVASGELSLGRPCIPYNITKYTAKQGKLEKRAQHYR